MAKPGDTLRGYFLTESASGTPTNADATPVVDIRRNGEATGLTASVTNPAAGEYGFAFAVPTSWAGGDLVVAVADIILGGQTYSSGVGEWSLDASASVFNPPTTNGLPGTRDEWKFWPNLEVITLRELTATSYTSRSVPFAKRRAVNTREAIASGGVYTQSDLVWLIPNEVLPSGVKPKPGDRVRETNGTDWTVLEIQPLGKFGNTWRLTTRNLVLNAQLRSVGRVLRPDSTLDTAGQRSPVFAVVYQDLPCRVQEQSQTLIEDLHGGPNSQREYVIWFDQRLTLRAGDVIEIDSIKYDFSGSANWDRIDQLGEVRAYRIGV